MGSTGACWPPRSCGAVGDAVDDPGLRLRSAHVSFRSPPTDPHLVIDVDVARRGGITAHLEATARGASQEAPSTVVTTLFTRDKFEDDYLDAVHPDAPPADEAVAWAGASDAFADAPLTRPPVFDHIEMRSADGGDAYSGPGLAPRQAGLRLPVGPLPLADRRRLRRHRPPHAGAHRRLPRRGRLEPLPRGRGLHLRHQPRVRHPLPRGPDRRVDPRGGPARAGWAAATPGPRPTCGAATAWSASPAR